MEIHYNVVENTSQISGGTLATNTFYHVAERNGGTTKLFLDGTELGTYTDNNDYGSSKPVIIGSDYQEILQKHLTDMLMK